MSLGGKIETMKLTGTKEGNDKLHRNICSRLRLVNCHLAAIWFSVTSASIFTYLSGRLLGTGPSLNRQ
jgi:hypothetical protein